MYSKCAGNQSNATPNPGETGIGMVNDAGKDDEIDRYHFITGNLTDLYNKIPPNTNVFLTVGSVQYNKTVGDLEDFQIYVRPATTLQRRLASQQARAHERLSRGRAAAVGAVYRYAGGGGRCVRVRVAGEVRDRQPLHQ